MTIRIYIGNLPQDFNSKEFDTVLKSVAEGVRFKPVLDKETKECRGFGFATTGNEKNANLLIEKLNGLDFQGSKLRVELSEKKDSSNKRNNAGNKNSNKRKNIKKVVHSDAPNLESPDPRWAGELSKLKDLLANQKTPA